MQYLIIEQSVHTSGSHAKINANNEIWSSSLHAVLRVLLQLGLAPVTPITAPLPGTFLQKGRFG